MDLLPYVCLSVKRHPFAFVRILDRNALLGKCTAAIVSLVVDCAVIGKDFFNIATQRFSTLDF